MKVHKVSMFLHFNDSDSSDSFSPSQYKTVGYEIPFWLDRDQNGSGRKNYQKKIYLSFSYAPSLWVAKHLQNYFLFFIVVKW